MVHKVVKIYAKL